MSDLIYTNTISSNSNILDFKLSQAKMNSKEIVSWDNAKRLHINLISGIVCRKEALEIFPQFYKVSGLIYNKNWDQMIKEGRSPYFVENRISLGKRRGTCACRCSLEYIADEVLYGGGYPKIKPNPNLGLRQEESYGYRFDGEEPVKAKLPPFVFSTSQKLIKEA
jgi:hypothetical protein